nr:8947_t:CDS:2 [Entrophospora candida]
MVQPNTAEYYKPPDRMSQQLWLEAQKNNPDRKTLVPALVVGFDDIKKRISIQEDIAGKAINKFKELESELATLERIHKHDNLTKIQDRKLKHLELTQRLIKLMNCIQILRNKGNMITANEELLRNRLETIKEHYTRLSNQLDIIKANNSLRKPLWNTNEPTLVHKFNTVDENQMESIIKVLDSEQQGIDHTINVLKKDSRDTEYIITEMNNKSVKKQ